MNDKKFTRSASDKYLAGVSGGLGRYFGVDANIIRIIFVLAAIFVQPFGWLIYLILWLIMPLEDGGPTGLDSLKKLFNTN